MRFTYTDLIEYAQDGAGTTSTTIKTFLKRRINERYELVTDKLNTWTQSIVRTATSGDADGDSEQFYYNPPNLREFESIVVTIDDYDYVLTPVDSQAEWDRLNSGPQAGGAYPLRYFRRSSDYGIWPYEFEDDGTITTTYTQRATPLYFEDYTTGTAKVTENDQTVTLTTGVTTTFKAGFWFTLTDSNGEPRGTSYRILSITDATNFELETFFEETGESGVTYIVGQTPEIPEETQVLLAVGAISDFYALKRKDLETATRFDNKFWTGNYNVTPLQAKKDMDYGGLLAAIDAYADRDSSVFVTRIPSVDNPLDFRIPTSVTVE